MTAKKCDEFLNGGPITTEFFIEVINCLLDLDKNGLNKYRAIFDPTDLVNFPNLCSIMDPL